MSCCGTPPTLDEMDEVSRLVSARLAAFLRTLRDNAFAVGLREGQDARGADRGRLCRQARPAALGLQASVLRAQGRLGRSSTACSMPSGSASACARAQPVRPGAAAANNPSLKSLQDGPPQAGGQSRDRSAALRRRGGRTIDAGEGRMEGASRAENLADVDFRKIADPGQIAEAHAVAARLARRMRTRLTRRDLARRRGYRLDLRRTIHRNISHGGVPIEPGQAAAQGEAAAARHPARRLGLDEPLHRRLPALHPRRARRVPRGRGLPVPHAARPRLRRDEGEGRRRARSTGCR